MKAGLNMMHESHDSTADERPDWAKQMHAAWAGEINKMDAASQRRLAQKARNALDGGDSERQPRKPRRSRSHGDVRGA